MVVERKYDYSMKKKKGEMYPVENNAQMPKSNFICHCASFTWCGNIIILFLFLKLFSTVPLQST